MQSLHRVEKSPPLMVRAALGREIFRLRVSWERFPSVTYQHAAPLEMTMTAGSIQSFQKGTNPIPVISTVAKRSGEISPSDGTGGITAGALQAQSIMGAFSICHIPTCGSARDDGGGFAALESAQTIEPGRRRRHPAFGNTASRQPTADSR